MGEGVGVGDGVGVFVGVGEGVLVGVGVFVGRVMTVGEGDTVEEGVVVFVGLGDAVTVVVGVTVTDGVGVGVISASKVLPKSAVQSQPLLGFSTLEMPIAVHDVFSIFSLCPWVDASHASNEFCPVGPVDAKFSPAFDPYPKNVNRACRALPNESVWSNLLFAAMSSDIHVAAFVNFTDTFNKPLPIL